jgi:hypothetical protein
MRQVFIFLCLIFCNIPTFVQAQYPTDSAKVYLITASPGKYTYSVFGHSALRVLNPSLGYDYVYNWGTFDFDTENFYLKFGTGKLMYFLSVADYQDFLHAYFSMGQAIYLQKINLNNKDKFNLINNLRINDTEENRYFRYDFFRDNCATRIRDIIEKSVEGKIVYDNAYVSERESFRRLVGDYLRNQPWTYLGLNLIMGKSADSIAFIRDYMFLPGHLANLFTSATIVGTNGTAKLTNAPIELFPSKIVIKEASKITGPVAVFVFLFVIVLALTVWEYRSKHYYKGVDIFLFLVTGMLGLLITWLWGWSLHITLHNNMHILWASPLNFIAALALIFMSTKSVIRYYFGFYALSLLVFIPVSFFITQELPAATYFIMGVMIVRASHLFLRRKLQNSIVK